MAKSTKSKAVARKQTLVRAKRITKKGQLIKLLSCKAGSEIKAISEQLGWQHHTTRAALSGLRKAGYDVAVEKVADGKLARYRISPAPSQTNERTLPNGT